MATYNPDTPMGPYGYTLGAGADLLNSQQQGGLADSGSSVAPGGGGMPPPMSTGADYYPSSYSYLPPDHPDHPDQHEALYQSFIQDLMRRDQQAQNFDPNQFVQQQAQMYQKLGIFGTPPQAPAPPSRTQRTLAGIGDMLTGAGQMYNAYHSGGHQAGYLPPVPPSNYLQQLDARTEGRQLQYDQLQRGYDISKQQLLAGLVGQAQQRQERYQDTSLEMKAKVLAAEDAHEARRLGLKDQIMQLARTTGENLYWHEGEPTDADNRAFDAAILGSFPQTTPAQLEALRSVAQSAGKRKFATEGAGIESKKADAERKIFLNERDRAVQEAAKARGFIDDAEKKQADAAAIKAAQDELAIPTHMYETPEQRDAAAARASARVYSQWKAQPPGAAADNALSGHAGPQLDPNQQATVRSKILPIIEAAVDSGDEALMARALGPQWDTQAPALGIPTFAQFQAANPGATQRRYAIYVRYKLKFAAPEPAPLPPSKGAGK